MLAKEVIFRVQFIIPIPKYGQVNMPHLHH